MFCSFKSVSAVSPEMIRKELAGRGGAGSWVRPSGTHSHTMHWAKKQPEENEIEITGTATERGNGDSHFLL